MPQQKLDLFEIPAGLAAQFCATSSLDRGVPGARCQLGYSQHTFSQRCSIVLKHEPCHRFAACSLCRVRGLISRCTESFQPGTEKNLRTAYAVSERIHLRGTRAELAVTTVSLFRHWAFLDSQTIKYFGMRRAMAATRRRLKPNSEPRL
jgi:hypothetical protein